MTTDFFPGVAQGDTFLQGRVPIVERFMSLFGMLQK